ncbi:MAG: hypothetical protein ACI814_001559, partial [Mariniblastus sp.]
AHSRHSRAIFPRRITFSDMNGGESQSISVKCVA